MKKIYTTLFFLSFAFTLFARGTFEKGYIIDNKGTKTECLIENQYSITTPTKINYKIGDQILEGTPANIQSFEIYDFGKFESQSPKMALQKKEIEDDPTFNWKKETVFLQVLIQGNLSLYTYRNGYAPIYFYKSLTDTLPVQLKYRVSESGGVVNTDHSFRNQISYLAQPCNSSKEGGYTGAINRLQYNQDDLMNAFEKINKCTQVPYNIYVMKKRVLFVPHIALSAGITTNRLKLGYADNGYYSGLYKNTTSKTGPRIGAAFEVESIVYCKGYSILLEPYYQAFSYSKLLSDPHNLKVDLDGINLNIGLRKYFNVTAKTRLFVNGFINIHSFLFSPSLKYYYHFTYANTDQDEYVAKISTFGDLSLGGGLTHNRLGIELRGSIPHSITENNKVWNSSYSGVQAIVMVRLF